MIKRMCVCGNASRSGGRYCLECHARKMREFRKLNALNPEQRKKMNARSYSHVYVKRGKIIKEL